MSTTLEVSKQRNKRPIDVAHWQNPFDKKDKKPVNVLYHKSNEGYRLFSLNKNNRPIRCWSNINGISTIKSSLVSLSKFNEILHKLKPQKLYLNDGEHIHISNIQNIEVYFNKTLPAILKDIEIVTDINCQSNMTFKDENNIPTYADMRFLDPKMTKKEYNKFISKFAPSI